jgi:hypothetical protein
VAYHHYRTTETSVPDLSSIQNFNRTHYLERFDGLARYALIVTIRAPSSNADIFTPVEAAVTLQTPVETWCRSEAGTDGRLKSRAGR